MANYKSSVMSAPPLNRYRLTVNSHRGYVAATLLLFCKSRGRVLRDPIRNKYPCEKCIRIFFKILYPTKFYKVIHNVEQQCSIERTICSDTRLHALHLQPGESIAHCPTLTRWALIILTLFCKTVPQLSSDNAETIIDFPFFVKHALFTRRSATRSINIFFRVSARENCIICTHGAFIWLPESNTRISKYCV